MEGGQSTEVRNCSTMAVFLGPRQTMAEEREGSRRAREMAWREPMGDDGDVVLGGLVVSSFVAAVLLRSEECSPFKSDTVDVGGRIWLLCTSQGNHPPGAWVIFSFSRPRRRGMEGPVRSISRIPTDLPARHKESASCVVMEDLPTPPLPERTYSNCQKQWVRERGKWAEDGRRSLRGRCA